MTGKKNMVFGFFYLALTMGLGMYLANKLGSGDEWAKSMQHRAFKTAHVHGNLEALLNVIAGYLLCRFSINAGLAKAASAILIIGAVFHSGMFYLAGLGAGFATSLAPIGAVSLVLSMLLMGIGILMLRRIE